MLMPAPVASHDQGSHVHHFNCLDLTNGWCLWQWHLASGDTCIIDTSWSKKSHCTPFQLLCPGKCNGSMHATVSITWPKKSCQTSFQLAWPKKCNGAIVDAVAYGVRWQKETCYISFYLSLPKENSAAIYDAVGIMWHWYWSQWHHVTPTPVAIVSHDQKSHFTSNFDCLDLRNEMVTL